MEILMHVCAFLVFGGMAFNLLFIVYLVIRSNLQSPPQDSARSTSPPGTQGEP